MKFETQMRLAANLKQLRLSRGYSQVQLAKKIQVDRSVLAMYETGRRSPDPEILYNIACIYGLRMETLLQTDPAAILSEAACMKGCENGEQELMEQFRHLSSLSKGRLLEKAENLAAWDAIFIRRTE